MTRRPSISSRSSIASSVTVLVRSASTCWTNRQASSVFGAQALPIFSMVRHSLIMDVVSRQNSRESLTARKQKATRARIAAAAAQSCRRERPGRRHRRADRGRRGDRARDLLPVLQLEGRRRRRGHDDALAGRDHGGHRPAAGASVGQRGRGRGVRGSRRRLRRDQRPGARACDADAVISGAQRVDAADLPPLRGGHRRSGGPATR